MRETATVDNCQCVYCNHIFNGREACNGNMDCWSVKCPECEKEMYVALSIEYVCTEIEEETK